MTNDEELNYWRNVGINLLTDSQLDVKMPYGYSENEKEITPRELLGEQE